MTHLTQKQKKALALFALANQPETQNKTEMSLDKIFQYCDNQLDEKQEQAFKEEILNDPKAYELWMLMEENRDLWETPQQKNRWFIDIAQWLKSHQFASITATMSLLVISSVILLQNPTLELTDSYLEIAPSSAISFNFTTQGQVKGLTIFVDGDKEAFKKGALDSIQYIQQKTLNNVNHCLSQLESCQTKTDLYYYIGAWSAISKVACQQKTNKLYQNQRILIERWKNQAEQTIPLNNTGLSKRLNQLYQQAQRNEQTDFCATNNELLNFVML